MSNGIFFAGVDTRSRPRIVENVGVPPDIEVEQLPADIINGHDPQLEKAIQVVMKELKKYPASQPQRPAYPVKSK